MEQVMNYHKDNGLLNMIRRTDPMINMPRMGRVPNENRGRNQKPVIRSRKEMVCADGNWDYGQ